jgi:uncharacterized membrane protein YphA (DoxX/SURF4 family)
MKIDEFLNDKTLSGLSLLLIFLWIGAKTRLYSLSKVDGQIGASTLLRIVCGFLLAGASLDKLGDPTAFSTAIKECYDVVPVSLVPLASVVIPWLEFFTGLCLISGFKWRGASLIFCALMIIYTFAITWDLCRGIDCDCGCFKMNAKEKMTWWTVLRDLGFFGMGFIVLASPRTYAAMDYSNNKKSFS